MSDYIIIDATNQFARARYAAQASNLLSPLDEHLHRQLKKKDVLTDEEQEQLDSLNKNYNEAIIGFATHLFFSIIFSLIQKFQDHPTPKRVILAWDKGSWRYDEYPEYKGKRRKARAEQTESDKALQQRYYAAMDDTIEQLRTTNLVNMQIDHLEADDIAGILCTVQNKKIMVVTSDSDYHQLLSNPNVSIYDPIKKRQIKLSIMEANYVLLEKLIRGDSTDSIPSSFPRLRKTRIKEWSENPIQLMSELSTNKEFEEKYERNRLLIDFKKIPVKFRLPVFKSFTAQLTSAPKSYRIAEWTGYLSKYKLVQLASDLDKIQKFLY